MSATHLQGTTGPRVIVRHGRTGSLVTCGEHVRATATEQVLRIRTREVTIATATIQTVAVVR